MLYFFSRPRIKSFYKCKKKHSFLLLELMIAFTLILSCSFLFIFNPSKTYKKQLEALYELECTLVGEALYMDLKKELPNLIKWDEIPSKKGAKKFFKKVKIKLEGLDEKEFQCFYSIHGKILDRKKNEFRLLDCQIYLDGGEKYRYNFLHKLFLKKAKDEV